MTFFQCFTFWYYSVLTLNLVKMAKTYKNVLKYDVLLTSYLKNTDSLYIFKENNSYILVFTPCFRNIFYASEALFKKKC